MPEIRAKIVLTDIEGTTTSISFVKDVLFPYAAKHTKSYLEKTWADPDTEAVVADLLALPQYEEFAKESAVGNADTLTKTVKFVQHAISRDMKLTPLKSLQGMVWQQGYQDELLQGHVYDDVKPAFDRWVRDEVDVAIYSSGSVEAQRLLFLHSTQGNLLPYIKAHFDTNVGHKQDKKSYEEIARSLFAEPKDILFLTDVVKEAKAAKDAGMQTILLVRPDNAELSIEECTNFNMINDFNSLIVKS